jgi:hypothetical protein
MVEIQGGRGYLKHYFKNKGQERAWDWNNQKSLSITWGSRDRVKPLRLKCKSYILFQRNFYS